MRLHFSSPQPDSTLAPTSSSACHSSAVSAACQEMVSGRRPPAEGRRSGVAKTASYGMPPKAVGKTNDRGLPGGSRCRTTCCIPTVAESERDYRLHDHASSRAGESLWMTGGASTGGRCCGQLRRGLENVLIGISTPLSAAAGSTRTASPLYTNWNEQYRQPNNYHNQDLAIINAGDVSVYDGSWFDAPDGSYAYALCNVYPPPPSPPSPPPPSGSTVIIAVGAGAGGVVVLLLVLVVIVLSRKATPVVPNTMAQPQSQIEMGAVGGNAAVIGVAQPAAVASTSGASTSGSSSSNLAFAPRFDVNTGQPIPKFDPETGKQNWARKS